MGCAADVTRHVTCHVDCHITCYVSTTSHIIAIASEPLPRTSGGKDKAKRCAFFLFLF